MRTILIAMPDSASRRRLVEALAAHADELEVLEAQDGAQAAEILRRERVDVLATELDMPVMDGFELVASLMEAERSPEIVILGSPLSGRVGQALTGSGAFPYLKAPVSAAALLEAVRELDVRPAQGRFAGLSLWGIVQLLSGERRSCSLEVMANGTTGRIDLEAGEVLNAICGSLKGKPALYELLSWQQPEFEARELPAGVERTIHEPLTQLLLQAIVWQDEHTFATRKPGDVEGRPLERVFPRDES